MLSEMRILISPSCDSPPRGRFSHMAMFRIGSALFIPAYITVTLYRSFANEHSQGSILVMSGKHFFNTCVGLIRPIELLFSGA
jgi:hypothetical protein